MDCCLKRKILGINNPFPNFNLQVLYPNSENSLDIQTIDNEKIKDKRTIFFFYPLDFTFVCPTELIELNKHWEEIKQYANVITISTDSVYSHHTWKKINPQIGQINFPMGSDINQNLSRQLGVINSNGICDRATYMVNKDGIIEWLEVSPEKVGRSATNLLRVLKAICSDAMCAAGWEDGDEHITIHTT